MSSTPQYPGEVADIAQADLLYRTTRDIDNVVALLDYYRDTAAERTRAANRALGVGIREAARPLQIGLLRYAIDRQAVVYSGPPTRWLLRNGQRLQAEDPQNQLMRRVYARSRIDLVCRKLDRLRNITGVVALEFAANGDGSVRANIYTPDLIRRQPDPMWTTDIRRDHAFALAHAGDHWTTWRPLAVGETAGPWSKRTIDGNGNQVASGLAAQVPVVLVYDDLPTNAYPPIREHRLAACEAINAMANDLWANVRAETHTTRVWKGVPMELIPDSRGPGVELGVPVGTEVVDLTPKPQINASADVFTQMVSLYLISEDLPPDDLDKSKQVLTGAALRTRLFGLIERRKAQAMLAAADEDRMFVAIRQEYNAQAVLLGLPLLAADTTMEIELAPMDLPVDANLFVEAALKSIGAGILSKVEAVMRDRGIGREEALRVLEQIGADLEEFGGVPAEVLAGAATQTPAANAAQQVET
jgi:hypothetical protein